MGTMKDGIPLLTGQNFENWSYRVQLHFEGAELAEVFTADVPAAAAGNQDREKFLKLDRKAKTQLVGFISEECLGIVKGKETTKLMWQALEGHFLKKSVASQTIIRMQLARLRMKEGTGMRSHFQCFDDLVRQLKSVGAKLEEGDLIAQLFLSLPESFDPLVTALENLDEKDISLELCKQRLLAEEAKRINRMEESPEVTTAAFVGQKKKFSGKCRRCGKKGHMAKDCRVKLSEGQANAVVKERPVSFMVNQGQPGRDSTKVVFYVDSGCSDHLVNNLACLKAVRKLKHPFIVDVAKDGVSLTGSYEGVLEGVTMAGVPVEMKEVVFLPELRGNLMSVKKLSKAGVDVLFTGSRGQEKAVMKFNGAVIAVAYLRNNLYELELEVNMSRGTANLCAAELGKLWHRRLGHASQQAMDNLVKHEMVTGINTPLGAVGFCDTCVLGKQAREPFSGRREPVTRPLERIHSDVCGPIDPPGWDGSRYFVSFIDDYTHFAMVYTIKKKSEVFESFKEYEALVTTQLEKKICKMTVDQGREYCSNQQLDYYKRRGIQLQPTVAYSPQQNGVSERFNRTVVEKSRTMMIDAKVPKNLWPEAVQTATYILNRSSTAAIVEKETPVERWTNIKPDLEKLRVFGCQAFAWIPNQQRKKLDPKSRETVMIGYAPNGYRLWDQRDRKVVIARDVKFNEAHFPFAEDGDAQSAPPLMIQVQHDVPEGDQRVADFDVPVQDAAEVEVPPIGNEADDDTDDAEFCDADGGAYPADDDAGGAGQLSAEEDNPGALPSQQRGDGFSESNTRRSDRERKFPGKFLDFLTYGAHCAVKNSELADPPLTFDEINTRADGHLWKAAVDDELRSLDANAVWKLVKCPSGIKPLKSKWVLRVKEDESGNPVRYKARLVVKGFLQKAGLDYHETYAPVAKLVTIRTALAVGVQRRCYFHQMDVKTAFLHGKLQETIFMAVPDGVQAEPGTACQLLKSLYGLKQSPRCWNERFNQVLVQLGFTRSKYDYCLYTRFNERGNDAVILVLYVDDLLIIGKRQETIQKLKMDLAQTFEMTDCGEVKFFLGMKIDYNWQQGRMKLSQAASIDKVLKNFGMENCNPTKTPMEKGLMLERQVTEAAEEPYRELLGSLMYMMMSTRPDICFSVGYLGRFQQQPGQQHWTALKRVVRYMKGTKQMNLEINRCEDANCLLGFADADWATDTEDRKSVSGFLFQVYGNTVSWSSKKQTTVATSSSEAEYVALSAAASEAIWLSGLLGDLGEAITGPVTIFEDNHGCIGMAKNLESKRAKHIDIKHHFIRDHVADGKLNIQPIGTTNQLADIFTKALDPGRFGDLRGQLGLRDREGV